MPDETTDDVVIDHVHTKPIDPHFSHEPSASFDTIVDSIHTKPLDPQAAGSGKVGAANFAGTHRAEPLDANAASSTDSTAHNTRPQTVASHNSRPQTNSTDSSSVRRPSSGRRPSTSVAGTSEEARIDTDVLRATAAEGEQKIKQLKEKLETLTEAVKSVEANGAWVGRAAGGWRAWDGYLPCLLHVLETFSAQVDLFAAYPRELVAYADEYEGTVTEANRIAAMATEAIEQAMWDTDV